MADRITKRPGLTSWRDLFDLVLVHSRKPDFFRTDRPFIEIRTLLTFWLMYACDSKLPLLYTGVFVAHKADA